MNEAIRRRLTFANVVSVIALFVALGGGAYAISIGKGDVKSRHIAKGAVKSKQLKNDDVRSIDIEDGQVAASDLGPGSVGSGAIADASVESGDLAANVIADCPDGTFNLGDSCIETTNRGGADFNAALADCADEGRRLPSLAELDSFHLNAGPTMDLWSNAFSAEAGSRSVVTGQAGSYFLAMADATQAYRCVVPAR